MRIYVYLLKICDRSVYHSNTFKSGRYAFRLLNLNFFQVIKYFLFFIIKLKEILQKKTPQRHLKVTEKSR